MRGLPDDLMRERGELPFQSPLAPPRPLGMAPAVGASAPNGFGEMRATGWNQSNWQSQNFTAGLTVVKLQDYLLRKFLSIQNKSATGVLYIGFGWIPTPDNAFVLNPGETYEPYTYPTNEIYALSSEANTAGLLIYGV